MELYNYQEAFGASDKTSDAMRAAIRDWFSLYYRAGADSRSDPSQRIAYTVVNKLIKTVFAEYNAGSDDPAVRALLQRLDAVKKEAVQLALVGGECYLKPCIEGKSMGFGVIPRDNVLIFARDPGGMPTDMGTVEKSTLGRYYYTLLERRTVDEKGFLTIQNRLFRSLNSRQLGAEAELSEHPLYVRLPKRYTYERPVGSVGLVRLRTPMLNCVDGSPEGVSVYAAAAGLIRSIDRNEAQLSGEFDRGESRIIVSADLLDRQKQLTDHLFVGLDEDPEHAGITVFSPALREQSFLARKQEYLRNVESLVGLRRGLLSDTNIDQRTATEIAASEAEYNLTVMGFQQMWEQAVRETLALCDVLSGLYGLERLTGAVRIDWGNGVLYDEDKQWQDYLVMVERGLLRPEIALGWRFGMPAGTEEERAVVRNALMPEGKGSAIPSPGGRVAHSAG